LGYDIEDSLHRADIGAHINGKWKPSWHRFIVISLSRRAIGCWKGCLKKKNSGIGLKSLDHLKNTGLIRYANLVFTGVEVAIKLCVEIHILLKGDLILQVVNHIQQLSNSLLLNTKIGPFS
jgi:hypothetical protein